MAQCNNAGVNTGTGQCDIQSQTVGAIIFCDKKASIPKSTTDIMAYLKEKFKAAATKERLYPFNQIQQGTDNTEEAQMGTFAYGASVKFRNGNAMYEWDMPFTKCLAGAAIGFDGWKGGVYLISRDGNLLCRESADGESYLPLVPSVPVYVSKANPISMGNTDLRVVSFSVNLGDNLLFTKNMRVVPMEGFDNDELVGLIDLKLTVVSKTATALNVRVETSCGGLNLFEDYKDELSAVNMWKLTNATTGGAVTITGVTAVEGTEVFTLAGTFDSAATYKLSLVDTAALAAAGVDGYESNATTFSIS